MKIVICLVSLILIYSRPSSLDKYKLKIKSPCKLMHETKAPEKFGEANKTAPSKLQRHCRTRPERKKSGHKKNPRKTNPNNCNTKGEEEVVVVEAAARALKNPNS